MHDTYKWLVSTVSGALAAFFGQYGLSFVIVAVAVVFDVITGLVKALASGEGLDSNKARVGFWRKITLFIALFFGIFLDFSIKNVIIISGIPFNHSLPFALIVAAYIIINEGISICENLYQVNPDAFPPQIGSWLKVAKTDIEKQGVTPNERNDGRNDDNDDNTGSDDVGELHQPDSARSRGGEVGTDDRSNVDSDPGSDSTVRGDECSVDNSRAPVRDSRNNRNNNPSSRRKRK